jgi:Peptidase inhibitor family I36
MTKINNQSNSLYSIECVQDISHESAAALSGGIAVYTDSNFGGFARTAKGVSDLTQVDRGFFNDKISSIKNDTDKRWAFYKDAGYSGDRFTLEPGQSFRFVGGRFNDSISSYRSEVNGSAQPL